MLDTRDARRESCRIPWSGRQTFGASVKREQCVVRSTALLHVKLVHCPRDDHAGPARGCGRDSSCASCMLLNQLFSAWGCCMHARLEANKTTEDGVDLQPQPGLQDGFSAAYGSTAYRVERICGIFGGVAPATSLSATDTSFAGGLGILDQRSGMDVDFRRCGCFTRLNEFPTWEPSSQLLNSRLGKMSVHAASACDTLVSRLTW